MPDGLKDDDATIQGDGDFDTSALDWSPNGLLLGRSLYRVPDLTLLGHVNVHSAHCRPLSIPNRFVCLDNPQNEPGGTIAVVDATTFVILSKAAYHRSFMNVLTIVPGPIGQIALRTNILPGNRGARSLSFFNSPALE